jgi:hypothetical protein
MPSLRSYPAGQYQAVLEQGNVLISEKPHSLRYERPMIFYQHVLQVPSVNPKRRHSGRHRSIYAVRRGW